MTYCTVSGGKQSSSKDELILVKRQLASVQSVITCLLELSVQYQLDHDSGRFYQ